VKRPIRGRGPVAEENFLTIDSRKEFKKRGAWVREIGGCTPGNRGRRGGKVPLIKKRIGEG